MLWMFWGPWLQRPTHPGSQSWTGIHRQSHTDFKELHTSLRNCHYLDIGAWFHYLFAMLCLNYNDSMMLSDCGLTEAGCWSKVNSQVVKFWCFGSICQAGHVTKVDSISRRSWDPVIKCLTSCASKVLIHTFLFKARNCPVLFIIHFQNNCFLSGRNRFF